MPTLAEEERFSFSSNSLLFFIRADKALEWLLIWGAFLLLLALLHDVITMLNIARMTIDKSFFFSILYNV